MARKKNKKGIEGELKSEIANKYAIRISAPHGYFPEDVDNLIKKLENTISLLEKETVTLSEALEKEKEEKKIIDKELRTMKMNMTIMDIPDTSTEEDFSMMSRLENINPDVGGPLEKIPEIIESRIPLDILEENKDEDVFDQFVSKTVNKPKKKIKLKEETNSHKANIYNSDGELDII